MIIPIDSNNDVLTSENDDNDDRTTITTMILNRIDSSHLTSPKSPCLNHRTYANSLYNTIPYTILQLSTLTSCMELKIPGLSVPCSLPGPFLELRLTRDIMIDVLRS